MEDPNQIQSYKSLEISDLNSLMEANTQMHHASQFIAITGKNLIPDKPDDSNTNIGVIASGLIGRRVSGPQPFHTFIEIPGFKLQLVDPQMNRLWGTSLYNKDRDEILDELRSGINEIGLDGSVLKPIDHYKLEEEHAIQHGALFQKPEEEALRTWHIMYSNARIIISQASGNFQQADEVRIWPHHFDIGTYIPLNDAGTKALGLGLAIPDTVVSNFYFYIYGWEKDKNIDHRKFKPISIGDWKWGDYNGAVLPINSVDQKKDALQFFKEAIHEYQKVLN